MLGTALALFDDPELHDTDVELGPGEVLCVFTDGLVEARRGRELFGSERVADLLRRARRPVGRRAGGRRARRGTRLPRRQLVDDLAMLVVRHDDGDVRA